VADDPDFVPAHLDRGIGGLRFHAPTPSCLRI
jgi:hypothetical protein